MSDSEAELIDLPSFALVNCIASANTRDLWSLLGQQAYHILHLHGDGVVDKASLLAQAKNDLPHVDDLEPHNWDALSDYLWNGLYDLDSDKVAVIWTDSQQLAHADLQDFLDAVRIFSDLSRQLGQAEGGFPRPMILLLFLVGDGPEYRALTTF